MSITETAWERTSFWQGVLEYPFVYLDNVPLSGLDDNLPLLIVFTTETGPGEETVAGDGDRVLTFRFRAVGAAASSVLSLIDQVFNCLHGRRERFDGQIMDFLWRENSGVKTDMGLRVPGISNFPVFADTVYSCYMQADEGKKDQDES